jgi:hypothetical protein
MSMHSSKFSIWFFTGILLFIYGILITGAGIYNYSGYGDRHIVLAELHVDLWWGILLLVLGAVYLWIYLPSRQK